MRDRATNIGRGAMARWAACLAVFAATIAVSIAVLPELSSSGTFQTLDEVQSSELPEPEVEELDAISRTPDGYLVAPLSKARVSVPMTTSGPSGCRTLLSLSGASPVPGNTLVTVIAADGTRERLGEARSWAQKPRDVTELAEKGDLEVEINADNQSETHYLVFSGAKLDVASCDVGITAGAPLIGVWFALLTATVLILARALPRHWPLIPVAGLAAALVWRTVPGASVLPPNGQADALWSVAVTSSPLALGEGLLTGAVDSTFPLATSVYAALTPLVGIGDTAIFAAAALVAPLAVIAVYLLADRVAGRWPAVLAATLMVAADPFRLSGSTGSPAPVLVLVGVAFAAAVYLCIQRLGWRQLAALSVAASLCALANPVWLPGAAVATALVALIYADRGVRLRSAVVALALVAVLTAPNRLSTADSSAGDPFADVDQRATEARFAELSPDPGSIPPDGWLDLARRAKAEDELRIEEIKRRLPSADSIDQVRAAAAAVDPFVEHREIVQIHISNVRAVLETLNESQAGVELARQPTTLAEFLLVDRLPTATASGLVDGIQASLSGLSDRPETKLGGLIAFIPLVLGSLYLLVLPRLRMLILLPVLVAAPSLLMAGYQAYDPFLAGLVAWPGMLVGAAVLAYATPRLLRERYGAGGAP